MSRRRSKFYSFSTTCPAFTARSVFPTARKRTRDGTSVACSRCEAASVSALTFRRTVATRNFPRPDCWSAFARWSRSRLWPLPRCTCSSSVRIPRKSQHTFTISQEQHGAKREGIGQNLKNRMRTFPHPPLIQLL